MALISVVQSARAAVTEKQSAAVVRNKNFNLASNGKRAPAEVIAVRCDFDKLSELAYHMEHGSFDCL